MSSTSVLIVDDHARVRANLRLVLALWKEITVVGEAGGGQEAIRLSKELKPDVVLLDLDMPGMGGAEATQILCEQHPNIRIVILTGTVDYPAIKVAMAAGAMGYVLKTAPIDEIAQAILA